jgi:asparagine synthase (glutamine-hydrolysing)
VCGIWASIGLSPAPAVIDSVAYRGPDGRGWKDFASSVGHVVLAHRRLAIIDTSAAAAQPMAWDAGRVWLTYNGEIYNYVELRAELEAKGYRFATASDSEVLLGAYQEWGEACLTHFVGMFAFVIYEPQVEKLFAARDRFGVKPLYFWNSGAGLAFASEIKQFRSLPGFAARANVARCRDFLVGGLSDHTGDTLFAGVGQLRGGECISLDLGEWGRELRVEPRRWYRLPEANTCRLGDDEAAEKFRALFTEAVRLHLRANVTVGSCLSGGLDSSSIVGLAVEELRRQRASNVFHTVSACYEEVSVDERPFIEAVVAKAGVVNSQVFPQADALMDQIERVTWHQDEPFGSTSIFAQWCVFERAGALGIKVMLDGQGADEQLAGYHAMFPVYYRQLLRGLRVTRLIQTVAGRRRRHHAPLRGELTGIAMAMLPAGWLGPVAGFVRRRQRSDWLGAPLDEAGDADDANSGAQPPVHAAVARDGLGPIDGLGRACRAQVQTTSLPMLLHYEDRNSMAHSVEARVPFLDHRLVEFSIALGDRHKMCGAETKRILRQAMGDVLPSAVRNRADKLGFATPERVWFAGPLRGYVLDGVDDAVKRFPGFFNAEGLHRMAREMMDGVRPFDFKLWRAVNLGIWGRVFGVVG